LQGKETIYCPLATNAEREKRLEVYDQKEITTAEKVVYKGGDPFLFEKGVRWIFKKEVLSEYCMDPAIRKARKLTRLKGNRLHTNEPLCTEPGFRASCKEEKV